MQPITGVVQHYPWGDRAVHPRAVRPPARRHAVGRAVARHPSVRNVATPRRARPRGRDGHASLPAQGARRRPAAVAANPPERRTGPSRLPGRPLPRPLPEARAAVCADGVRGVLRRPPDRRDDRPPRGARPATALPPPSRPPGVAATIAALLRRQGRRRPDRRGVRREQPARGALGGAAGRAVPRRSERRRHAAAQLRPARTRRGDPARPRQPALLPRRRRRRADGGERQRRAGRVDDQARGRRRRSSR